MELLQPLAAGLALLAVAAVAFVRPEGALMRAGLAGAVAAIGAGVAWRLTQSAADGATHWLAAFVVGLAATALTIAAALLRNVLNAMGARALR